MDEFQNNNVNNQYGANNQFGTPNQYNVPNNGMYGNQYNPGVNNGLGGDVNNVNNGMGFEANNPINDPNKVNPNMEQNMGQNVGNNNTPPKKSGKGLLVAIVIFFLIAVIAIVGLILYSKGMLPIKNKESNVESNTVNVEEDTTVDEDAIYDCAIVTDLNTLPEDNQYRIRKENYDKFKTTKTSGVVEGVFNLNDEDVYRIKVNTNNMLLNLSAFENTATFNLIDENDNLIYAGIWVFIDEDDLEQKYEGLEAAKGAIGSKSTYNEWTYYQTDERSGGLSFI